MERLTKKCGDWGYTVPGLNSVVKDNAEIIGEMINKLAEYENTGLEPKEVDKLKSEQNKVAVEKLEELLKESSVEYHLCDSAGGKYKCSIFAVNDIFIKEQIKELKGESDE